MSSINDLMRQINETSAAAEPNAKLAMGDDAPPESGHPATDFQDRAKVPTGPEISESGAEQREQYGDMAGAGSGRINPEEDEPTEIGTELNHGGDDAEPELKPGEGVKDPGPDSEHPANTNNKAHKYASYTDPVELADALNEGAVRVMSKLAEDPSSFDAPINPKKDAAKKQDKTASDKTPVSRQEVLQSLLPTDQLAKVASDRVAGLYAPWVAEGINRANKVASFLSLLESDPKLAMESMGVPPEAAAAMAGGEGGEMPPEAAGEMPPEAAGGMPPGADAGGGGDELQQLAMLIEQVAAESGADPEQLAMEVAQLLESGGEGGGMPPEAAGGMPPEAAGGMPPGEGAPPAEAAPPAPEEVPPEEGKVASAPNTLKSSNQPKSAVNPDALRLLAEQLLNEAGKAQKSA
jgi:hypothetical protein